MADGRRFDSGEQICQLHHIRSHQQYADEDEWIQWARSGNDAADQAAEFALSTLPVHVQQLKRQAAHDIQQMNQAIGQIHQHMVRVAKLSVENKEKQIGAPIRTDVESPEVNWHAVALAAADRAPAKLRFAGMNKLLDWCQHVHDDRASLK